MGVNNLGLGLLLDAKDLASGVLGGFQGKLLEVVGGTSEAGKKIKAHMKEAGLGLSIFAAGAAGLAMLGPANDAASDFGFQLGRIRTVIDENALSTAEASRSTMGLAATYGILAGQQADSLYETISAGISDAAKATDLLTVANEFAVGGTTGLAGSVDVLTSAVNTYADQGLTARQASDLMFTAIAAGKTTAEQLSQSLGEVAPTAHAAGVSFAELQAAIAALTVQGIKTPQAVTGLNAMLSNLQKPSSDAAKEAKRLGIEFGATALKTLGLQGVLAQLAGNTKVNDETFVNLFGSIDGVKAALALTAGGGAKFNEVLEQMKTSSGATRTAFQIMANTTRFQENRLAALTDNAKILIGQAIEPLRVSVLKTVNAILEGFNSIPAPVRSFLVQAFAVGSALLAVVGGALAIKSTLALVGPALSALGVTGAGVLSSLLPVVGTLALVALGFAALKGAYDANLGGFADKVNSAMASAKLAFSAIGQLLSDGAFSGDTMAQIDLAENSGIKDFAIEVFLIANRIQAFFGAIGDGFTASLDKVQPALDSLLASVAPIGEVFSSLFASDGADANAAAFDQWAAAGESVGGVLAEISAALLNILSWVGSLLSGAVAGIAELGPTFSGLWDSIVEAGDALKSLGKELGLAGDKGVGVGEIFYALGRGIAGVLGGAVGIVRGVVVAISGIIRGLANVIGGVIDIVVGLFTGDWDRAWVGAKKVVFGLVQAVIVALGGIAEGIAGAIDAIAAAIGRKTNLADNVRKFRIGLEQDAQKFFGLDNNNSAAVPGAPAGAGTPGTTAGAPIAAGPSKGSATDAAVAAVGAQVDLSSLNAANLVKIGQQMAAAGAKPPTVNANTTVLVQIDGESIPTTTTTRTQVGAGIPVAPAGV